MPWDLGEERSVSEWLIAPSSEWVWCRTRSALEWPLVAAADLLAALTHQSPLNYDGNQVTCGSSQSGQ